jgi:hypothetical protein
MNPQAILMIASEPEAARQKRHQNGRPSACESFITALGKLRPDLFCERVAPVDDTPLSNFDWSRYAAALFAGSPLHFYDGPAEVQRVLASRRREAAGHQLSDQGPGRRNAHCSFKFLGRAISSRNLAEGNCHGAQRRKQGRAKARVCTRPRRAQKARESPDRTR